MKKHISIIIACAEATLPCFIRGSLIDCENASLKYHGLQRRWAIEQCMHPSTPLADAQPSSEPIQDE